MNNTVEKPIEPVTPPAEPARDWKPRKRRFGDRRDGRSIRTLAPYFCMIPYIMVERNDATNLFEDWIDIGPLEKYVKEKQAQGMRKGASPSEPFRGGRSPLVRQIARLAYSEQILPTNSSRRRSRGGM
jgi:hypothetical protein